MARMESKSKRRSEASEVRARVQNSGVIALDACGACGATAGLGRARTSTTMDRLLLSVEECAQLAGNSGWWWRRAAYTGKVASVKLGSSLKIPKAEVDRIIAESMRPRNPAAA